MNPLIAIYAWPVVVAILFGRYRIEIALLVSLTAGYLLLPTGIAVDLPFLPGLDKNSVPALMALVMCLIVVGARTGADGARWLPRGLFGKALIVALVAANFLTGINNADPLVYGPRFIQGIVPYDMFSFALQTCITLVPFLLAHRLLATSDRHRSVLIVLAVAGLLYSLLAMYEVRMSPQLNNMVYGFFPHSWIQHVRGGGYRPLVFLDHGLRLAIFLACSWLAILALTRLAGRDRRPVYVLAALWMLGTLILAKSLGALLIALAFAPVMLFAGARGKLLAAAIISGIVLLYPVTRSAGWIPVDRITAFAGSIDPQRAESFGVRTRNEELLLGKARERLLFGWGGWGRSRVYDELGRDISITDGYWIILLGVGGWTRYATEFGLLILPIAGLMIRRRRYRIDEASAALALVLAANIVDLVPNSSVTPITWMLAGALWGRLAVRDISVAAGPDAPGDPLSEPSRPGTAYTRQTAGHQRRPKTGETRKGGTVPRAYSRDRAGRPPQKRCTDP